MSAAIQDPRCPEIDEKCVIVRSATDTLDQERIRPATRQLAIKIINRSIVSSDEVARLAGEGADVNAAVSLRVGIDETEPRDLLSVAIDEACTVEAMSLSVGSWTNEDNTFKGVKLPMWPSSEMQRAVLEALIAAGADVDGDSSDCSPAYMAFANPTAMDILLKAGTKTRDMDLGFLPRDELIPSPPSPHYEAALLAVYRLLFQHDPPLATEQTADGETPIQAAGYITTEVSPGFMHAYLDLLAANGASLTVRDKDGDSPLDIAVAQGALHVVDWLCGKLGAAEINENYAKIYVAATGEVLTEGSSLCEEGTTPFQAAGEVLRDALRDKVSAAEIERRRQVIRQLLQHGASVKLLPSTTASERLIRKYVLEIQRGMGETSAPAQQQKRGCEAATAAKMAEELIAEEAREKTKKNKKRGKKRTKSGHDQERQHLVSEAIDEDDEPSVSSTTPANPRKAKQRHSANRQQQQQPAPANSTQTPNMGGRPFPSSAVRPPAGQSNRSPIPTDIRTRRSPPPLAPMAVVQPSASRSAYPPAHVGPHGLTVRQDANRVSAWTNRNNGSTGGNRGPMPPTFPPAAATMDHPNRLAQLTNTGGQESTAGGRDSEHLADQLCRHLEQTQLAAKKKEDVLIRQLQETQWKLAQAMNARQQPSSPSSSSAPLAAADDGEHFKCDVCMDKDKSILLIPCRHLCMCGECADRLMGGPLAKRLCPRCRQPITDTQQVYL
ncbi:unnamed protein product [Vitrella brassicaformis CCMP3155]|uniref:RING-type domain-containing protein n=3 Tax=Vitrella brassicaformis TaxID=1169539 RepID=A0A0G4GPZ7_VITBC|nr:unnamed protein product [Vitrella brassicaformis CCMP3155]|eukprot:CEM32451.1 unnamed protein product [Vitrella brassicaformis CCMP3155]